MTAMVVRVEKSPTWSLVRVAGPRGDQLCPDVLAPDFDLCQVEEKLVPTSTSSGATALQPVYTAVPLALTAPGVDSVAGGPLPVSATATDIGAFTPAGPVRFVFRVSGTVTDGQLMFMDGTTVLSAVFFTAEDQGWFFGDLPTMAGTPVQVRTVTDGATVHQLLVYEAS